jgi:hypothetical protein
MATLQRIPIRPKLVLVKLCPCENESLLAFRKRTGKTFNRINTVDPDLTLIVRVEMRSVMRASSLDVHTNDYTKNLEISGIIGWPTIVMSLLMRFDSPVLSEAGELHPSYGLVTGQAANTITNTVI